MVSMRARWYEPTSGRFISEDPARDGSNWFAYCGGDPVNFSDESGKYRFMQGWVGQTAQVMFGTAILLTGIAAINMVAGNKPAAMSAIAAAAAFAAVALSGTDVGMEQKFAAGLVRLVMTNSVYGGIVNALCVVFTPIGASNSSTNPGEINDGKQGRITVLHEMAHACGIEHGGNGHHSDNQCNDIFGCCKLETIYGKR